MNTYKQYTSHVLSIKYLIELQNYIKSSLYDYLFQHFTSLGDVDIDQSPFK